MKRTRLNRMLALLVACMMVMSTYVTLLADEIGTETPPGTSENVPGEGGTEEGGGTEETPGPGEEGPGEEGPGEEDEDGEEDEGEEKDGKLEEEEKKDEVGPVQNGPLFSPAFLDEDNEYIIEYVSTFEELEAAILNAHPWTSEDEEENLIVVTTNIVMEHTITIPGDVYIIIAGATGNEKLFAGGNFLHFESYGNDDVTNRHITFENITLDGENRGGGIYLKESHVTLGEALVIENTTGLGREGLGHGAITIVGGALDTFVEDTDEYGDPIPGVHPIIRNNVSKDHGGAIYIDACNDEYTWYTIDDVLFENNSTAEGSNYHGGAIYIDKDGYGDIQSRFINNEAYGNGGAIYIAPNSSVRVQCSYFEKNESHGSGGAIFVNHASETVDIQSSFFKNNRTKNENGHGGAIAADTMDGSYLQIDYCKFIGNESMGKGGAVYIVNFPQLYFFNLNFVENKAKSDGGAVYIDTQDVDMSSIFFSDSSFVGNISQGSAGGGLYAAADEGVHVEMTEVTGNKVLAPNGDGMGGGFYLSSNNFLSFSSLNVDDNKADLGGGLYISGQIGYFDCSQISNNIARLGGGIYSRSNVEDSSDWQFDFELLEIKENTADYGGGIYHIGEFRLGDENNIESNSAYFSGGGIYSESGDLQVIIGEDIPESGIYFEPNSFIKNHANLSGGAIYLQKSTDGVNNDQNLIDTYERLLIEKAKFEDNTAAIPIFFDLDDTLLADVHNNNIEELVTLSTPFDATSMDGAKNKLYNNYDVNYMRYPVVAYNSMGGTAVEAEAVPYGTLATRPANPTKSGDVFEYWYRDSISDVYGFDTPVVEDTMLFAKWKNYVEPGGTEHTVTFDAAGGTPVPDPQTIDDGGLVNKPTTDPSKTGYTFIGWFKANDTEAYDFGTEVTSSFTLTARYRSDDYVVEVHPFATEVLHRNINKRDPKPDFAAILKGISFAGKENPDGRVQPIVLDKDGKTVDTAKVTFASLDYLAKIDFEELGTYEFTLQVTIDEGTGYKTVETTAFVVVEDTTPPEIFAARRVSYTVGNGPSSKEEFVKNANIFGEDNYDETVTFVLSFQGGIDYEDINWNVVSEYYMYVDAKDTSGNEAITKAVIIAITNSGGGGDNGGGDPYDPDPTPPSGEYRENDDGSWTFIPDEDVPLAAPELPKTGSGLRRTHLLLVTLAAVSILPIWHAKRSSLEEME